MQGYPVSKGRKKSGQNNKGANGGQQPSPPEKCLFERPSVQAIRIEPSSEENKRYSDEQSDRRKQLKISVLLNWITAIGAGISFLALVALFVSLSFSRKATNAAVSQAETTQREFESSQRPWLYGSEYQVGQLELGGSVPQMNIAFSITNVGHSVARNVSFAAILVPNDRDGGRKCESIAKEVRENAPALHTGYTVFPNQKGGFRWVAYANLTQMQESREHPVVAGDPKKVTLKLISCLSYTSSVDQSPHYTQLTFFVRHRGTGAYYFDVDSPSQDVELEMDINGTNAT